MGLSHQDFMAIFDEWAGTYDQTVLAERPADGFEDYGLVLKRVARLAVRHPGDHVADVGAGTGNLARELGRLGARVTALEPSPAMRQAAAGKLSGIPVIAGDFRSLPLPDSSQDAVASTYAFHHLPDAEKLHGAREMLRVLRPGGRIVLGDVAWADEEHRDAMLRRFRSDGKHDLVREIEEEEYYPTVGALTSVFARLGCSLYLEQVNDWVWILLARKPAG